MKNLIIILIVLISIQSKAQVYDMVVSKTMPGAYRSIKSAIGRIPSDHDGQFRIYITNGIYNEKVALTYNNISFIGEDVDSVIITNNDYNGDGTHGTSDSYTLWINASGFYAENLTIINSAGNVGQAVALKTDMDYQVYKNCKILGFQDTYYAHSGIQYLKNCYIKGTTDFIFGDATTVFDSCTINCVKGGQYITAPADSKLLSTRQDETTMIHGLLFKNCIITAEPDVPNNSYYLGRPWQPNASSVYMNCTLDNHIKNEGWSTWSDNNHLSSYFAEYKNVDVNGSLINISNRVSWSYQLSDDYASNYYNIDYFLTKEDSTWDPVPFTNAPDTPTDLIGDQYSLSWTEVPDAIGYVIIRNDSTIGFSETDNYLDETTNVHQTNIYKVKSVNSIGALSKVSNSYTVIATGVHEIEDVNRTFNIEYNNQNQISTTIPASIINIYSISGRLTAKYTNTQHVNISKLTTGIYVVKAIDETNNIAIRKIIIE